MATVVSAVGTILVIVTISTLFVILIVIILIIWFVIRSWMPGFMLMFVHIGVTTKFALDREREPLMEIQCALILRLVLENSFGDRNNGQ